MNKNGEKNLDRSIATDKVLYEEIYPSFKKNTTSNDCVIPVVKDFISMIKDSKALFSEDKCLKVGDIGCGRGEMSVKYLTDSNYGPGFDIRATDYNEAFAGNNKDKEGIAYENLSGYKKSNVINLKDFNVKQGDAFCGNLIPLLSKNNEELPKNSFDILFLSHAIYHSYTDDKLTHLERTDNTIKHMANDLLSTNGICFMIHTDLEQNGITYYRAKYGEKCPKPFDNTVTKSNFDASNSITNACSKNKIPCYEIKINGNLYYNKDIKSYAHQLQDAVKYKSQICENENSFDDYCNLSFMTLRCTDDMISDKSEFGMAAYVNEVIDNLKKNKKGNYYLVLNVTVHVILNPNCSDNFKRIIEESVEKTKAKAKKYSEDAVANHYMN